MGCFYSKIFNTQERTKVSMMPDKAFNQWLSDSYGSRRGAVLTCWYRLKFLLGAYKKYENISWGSIDRLVFVCKGNICRSAYAEAVARSLGVQAISCGIETVTGAPANVNAVESGSRKGIDLTSHRTTPIHSLTFNDSDLFVVMEPWQAEYVCNRFGGDNRFTLLGLWGRPVKPHIHDPYGLSPTYFDNCLLYIDECVNEITGKIRTED